MLYYKHVRKLSMRLRGLDAEAQAFAQARLANVRTVRAFANETLEAQRYQQVCIGSISRCTPSSIPYSHEAHSLYLWSKPACENGISRDTFGAGSLQVKGQRCSVFCKPRGLIIPLGHMIRYGSNRG